MLEINILIEKKLGGKSMIKRLSAFLLAMLCALTSITASLSLS